MKKKVQIIYIIILLAFAILIEVRLAYLESRYSILEMPEGSYSVLNGNYSISTSDYEIDGDYYHAVSADPQIYINELSNEVQTIGLEMSAESSFTAQVYYPDENGALSEEKSVVQTVNSGEAITCINIPLGNYPFLRIDINGDFILYDIQFSSEMPTRRTETRGLSGFSWIQVGANLLVLLLVHGAVMYKYGEYGYSALATKVTVFLRKKQTLIGLGICACVTVAVLLLSLVAGAGTIQNVYRFYFVLFAALAVLLCIWLRKAEIEVLFLVLSLTSGILLSVILPPTTLVSWDDETHYKWALEWTSVGDVAITQADVDIYQRTYSKDEMMNAATRNDAVAKMDADYKAGSVTTFTEKSRNLYQEVCYIPTIVGLQLGRILDIPYHIIFVLGRMANAIFYSIVVYFSIKITPVGKRILTVIGLLPTCIFMAANYSRDPWVISMTMLWVAMLFRAYVNEKERFNVKCLIPILIVYALACGPKAVYLPLGCMFLLLIWKRVEKGERAPYYIATGLVILCVMISMLFPFITGIDSTGYNDTRGGAGVSAAGQIAYIFSNPLTYAETLLSHVVNYISFEKANEYMTFFAYMGYGPHFLLLLVLLWVVVFLDRDENDSIILKSNVNRILVLLLMFGLTCLISTALYITFTPVGADTIGGVQPRYLLPLLFPTLVYVGSSRIKNKFPKCGFNLAVVFLSGAILLHGIWTNVVCAYTI